MVSIYARYTKRSTPDDQGVAQIAIHLKNGGVLTPAFLRRRNLSAYEEATRILRDHFEGAQEYVNLYHDLPRLTVGTALIPQAQYDLVVEELRRVKNFRTEPQYNDALDSLIARLVLLPNRHGARD